MEGVVIKYRIDGVLYKATDTTGQEFKCHDIDPGMPAEGAAAALACARTRRSMKRIASRVPSSRYTWLTPRACSAWRKSMTTSAGRLTRRR